jgi:hypothetical protein
MIKLRGMQWGLVGLLAVAPCLGLAGSERSSSTADTSRHPPKQAAQGSAAPPPATLGGYGSDGRYPNDPGDPYGRPQRVDPATARYWSEKCMGQRESGLSPLNHSQDCDNPAYTTGYPPYWGGRYGYPAYPPPYRGGGDTYIINRNENRIVYPRPPAPPEPLEPPVAPPPDLRPPVRSLR